MGARIRPSSTPCRIGARNEAWRHPDGRGRPGLCGEAAQVVIVQDDASDATDSITVCAFTTDGTEAPLFRLPVEPSESNGLRATCRLMVDKITTVPKSKIGAHIGRLDDDDVLPQSGDARVSRTGRLPEGEAGGIEVPQGRPAATGSMPRAG